MSDYGEGFIIHSDVYEPDSEMWKLVHLVLDLPSKYVNLPKFYVGLLRGGAINAALKHFSAYFLLAGHYRGDRMNGTWWSLFSEKKVPSAIQLIMRVFYHDEPPTQENTGLLMALNHPDCIHIEEIRMRYTPQVLMSIAGLEHVAAEERLAATRRILPGLGFFHPDTLTLIQKTTHGGPRYIKVADWPRERLEKLGSEYVRIKDSLTTVRKDAKKYYAQSKSKKNKTKWSAYIELDYPILKDYPDILNKMEQVYFGDTENINATGTRLEPHEIAWEIAARRSSPDYEPFSATAETFRKHAIKPRVDSNSPEIKS